MLRLSQLFRKSFVSFGSHIEKKELLDYSRPVKKYLPASTHGEVNCMVIHPVFHPKYFQSITL